VYISDVPDVDGAKPDNVIRRSSIIIAKSLFTLSRNDPNPPGFNPVDSDDLQGLITIIQSVGFETSDHRRQELFTINTTCWLWSYQELVDWLQFGQGPAHIFIPIDSTFVHATIDLAYGVRDGVPITMFRTVERELRRMSFAIGYSDLVFYQQRTV
jgi:hypothetical protein